MTSKSTIEFPAIVNLTIVLPDFGLTDEQFLAFCSINKVLRIERQADRKIIVKPPTAPSTGNQNVHLTYEINRWNKRSNLGEVFGPSSGFTLPNGAVRSPDVSWISRGRWNALDKSEHTKFAAICPDFIIELRSSSDDYSDLRKKMEEYIANGCRLAWLVDPSKHQTLVYLPNESIQIIPFGQKLEGGEVLPGFELVMDEVIAT